MAGEVVGTAFVRIKAITDGLAKDVKSQVEKGMKDAGLDDIGKSEGKKLGENLGESTVDSAKKTIKKKSKGIFQDVADEAERAAKESAELFRVFGDLPFDDGNRSFSNFIDNIKFKLSSADTDFREFFDRVSTGFRNTFDFSGGNSSLDRFLTSIGVKIDSADEQIRQVFNRMSDGFKDAFNLDDSDSSIGRFFDNIKVKLTSAETQFRGFFSRIRTGFSNAFDDDDSPLGRFVTSINSKLNSADTQLRRTFGRISDGFKNSFDGGIDSFDNLLTNIKLRLNSADIQFREFFGRVSAGFKNLGDGNTEFDDSLEKLGQKLKSFGSDASVSLGFLPKALIAIGAAITASLPFIQDIGATILAYATGLVAQVGFLATALGGLGVAAGAALGSAATAILPILLAFKAETETLTDFKDSLAAAGEEFLRIGVATQQTLLPALDEALFIIQDLIEPLSEFGLFVGRAVGEFAILAANTLTSSVALERFQAILQSALRILDLLLPTALNVGDIISGIWVAALPAAERFVGIISQVVERWRDMVNEGLRSGALIDTFDLWFDRAVTLGSAIGNVAGALFDILQIGANSSDDVFRRFDDWAERYRAFTESEVGQNRIALIFDNALEVMREVNGVAADLFDGIFGRLGEIGGVDSIVEALQKFREVLPQIQEGWANMLGPIREVVTFLLDNLKGKIEQAIEKLAEPLGRLATVILDLFAAMEESGAFETFLELIKILTNVLSTLLSIPGFGTFIGYLLAFKSALFVSRVVLGPFTSALGALVVGLVNLTRASLGAALGDTAGAISRFVAGFRGAGPAVATAGSQIAGAATQIGVSGGNMAGSIGAGAAALGGLALPLGVAAGALVIGGLAFYDHQQRVQAWRQEIRQAEEALGLLNGGLIISADGIKKYIEETSRFETRSQLDDLTRLGLQAETLAGQIEEGRISFQAFAQAALDAGEITVRVQQQTADGVGSGAIIEQEVESLQELARQYNLTSDELEELSKGHAVFGDGVKLTLDGNEDLIQSFVELDRVIGAAAKKNIDTFVSNATNIELLGKEFLNNLKRDIDDIDDINAGDAIEPMRDAMDQLGVAAEEASAGIVGISEETRRQIEEQAATAGSAAQVAVAEYELLKRESERLTREILADFELFNSDRFEEEFGEARLAITDFSDAMEGIDLTFIDIDHLFGGIDAVTRDFPAVGQSFLDLFQAMRGLPEAEFDAAARAMGADAEALRGAMDGAMTAIADLQAQAVESLPTIGSLLDDATSVQEDGSEFFDPEGFLAAARQRITDTQNFGTNIETIANQFGQETARLAVEQGPEAAASLATLAGTHPDQTAEVIAGMEQAEADLRTQISKVLGPGIAAQYALAADLVGTDFTIGLSAGLTDPTAVAALTDAGTTLANEIAEALDFYFVPTKDGIKAIRRVTASGNGNGIIKFSEGGYVGDGPLFNTGPSGTDTVNAWLTPGEFVLRRAVTQSIPKNVLTALNAGNPRMIGLLNSLNQSRPAGVDSIAATVSATVTGQQVGPGMVIQQMNVAAPSPLESARQIADHLRIMQSQLSRR